MQWKDVSACLHGRGQKAVCLDHHDGIARLERNNHIVKVIGNTQVQPFHRRLRHGFRRIAVQVGNPLAQGTVVQADTDGGSVLLADLDQFRKLTAGFSVVLVEITRIDPDFLDIGRHSDSSSRREMDVGDQRGLDAQAAQPVTDFLHVRNVLQARAGDPDQSGASLVHPEALLHRCFHIIRMGVAHGLRDNRMSAADRHVADPRCHCIHRWEGL